jgi:hypothetical protein
MIEGECVLGWVLLCSVGGSANPLAIPSQDPQPND